MYVQVYKIGKEIIREHQKNHSYRCQQEMTKCAHKAADSMATLYGDADTLVKK